MFETMLQNEQEIRMAFFLGVLVIMAIWEFITPKRRREIPRLIRWTNNIGIVMLDALVVRLTFPILAVSLAFLAQEKGWGLFNIFEAPPMLSLIVSFLALDLIIYLQHVAFHYVPWLWHLHRMHHTDTEIDVSTGLRFHPLEIIISMIIKCSAVIMLGAPPISILIFEVALNVTAMFSHSNIHIAGAIDRVLRLFFVTPDMHRVHHSVHMKETNSNFGFNLPWWDRIFGTYIAQPKDGHKGMDIGLNIFRNKREAWIDRLLTQPFRSHKKKK